MIDVSYRVIADHVRCLTFALTDGAIPSNEGRGYVLRRILRRAVRYGRQYLNMHEPFLCDLVEPLVNHMGDVFPELRTGMNPKRPIDNVKHVADILRDEEASFLKTLDRGIKLFNEAAEYAQRHHHGKISGEDAFKLHDTYGFPIDLTELMAEEQGMSIDIGEYERLMDEAREKARTTKTAGHNADYSRIPAELLRSRAERTGFVGYGKRQSWARIIGILGQAQPTEFVLNIKEGDAAFLVLDRSPFYGEKGGQVGDVGHIYTSTGEFLVEDTQNFDGIIIHTGRCVSGRIMECNPKFGGWVGEHRVPEELYGPGSSYMEYAIARVGDDTRLPTMQNHTATHLLNWALREVLCPAEEREHPHVQQKGSLVDPEKTRFDFSHNHPLSEVELHKVESLVNEHIHAGLTVYTNNNVEVDQAAAREITGLRAVFGEKYPDRVRVVSIGVPVGDEDVSKDRIDKSKSLLGNPNNPEWLKYSVEFCGGTHVSNTKEIEAFVLTEETGVAKGVRRVVGVSGKAAQDAIARGKQLLKELEALAGKPPVARGDLASRVAAFQEKLNKCETPIPISVRHTIRERLTELQKIVKEQGKASAAESGEAVMQRVAAMFKIAGAEPLRSLASGWGKVLGAPCGGAADVGSECCRVIAGVVVVVGEVPAANPDALRGAIDWVRNKADASAVLLAYVDDGKVTLMAGMSKDVVGRGVKAGDLIKEIAPLVGGKGGGRPDMAQGGGGDPGGLQNALAKASAWIAAKLG